MAKDYIQHGRRVDLNELDTSEPYYSLADESFHAPGAPPVNIKLPRLPQADVRDPRRPVLPQPEQEVTQPLRGPGPSIDILAPVRRVNEVIEEAAGRDILPEPRATPPPMPRVTTEIEPSLLPAVTPHPQVTTAIELTELAGDEGYQNFQRSISDAGDRFQGYLGSVFSAGPIINEYAEVLARSYVERGLAENLGNARFKVAKTLDQMDSRTVASEAAGYLWHNYDADIQNAFIATVSRQVNKIADETGNVEPRILFNNTITQPNGPEQLFRRMFDFTVRNPRVAGEELINFYRSADMLVSTPPEPEISTELANSIAEVEHLFGQVPRNLLQGIVQDRLTESLSGQFLRDGVPPVSGRILHGELLDLATRATLGYWESQDTRTLGNLQWELSRLQEAADDDMVIQRLQPEQIQFIRSEWPELAGLPLDTLMRAMLVNNEDLTVPISGLGFGTPTSAQATMSIQRRRQIGINAFAPAEVHWMNLGFTDEQVEAMREFATKGVTSTLPAYVARSRQLRREKEESTDALRNYMTIHPGADPPLRFFESLSAMPDVDTMQQLGVSPQTIDAVINRLGSRSDVSPADLAVKTIDSLGNLTAAGIGAFARFDEVMPDSTRRDFLEDPAHRPTSFSQFELVDIPGASKLGGPGEFLNAAYSAVVGPLHEMVTQPGSHWESRLLQDVRPDGTLRRRLTRIYEEADESGKRAMMDSSTTLAMAVPVGGARYDHPYLRAFLDLLDKDATVEEAAAEVRTLADVATSVIYGTSNVVFTPQAGFVWKATVNNAARRLLLRTPSRALIGGQARPLVRAGQAVHLEELDHGQIADRFRELQGMVHDGMVRDPRTGLIVPVEEARHPLKGVIDFTEGLIQRRKGSVGTREMQELKSELDEILYIDALHGQPNIPRVYTPAVSIKAPTSAVTPVYDTGMGILDHFKVYKPYMRGDTPATEFTLSIGATAQAADETSRLLDGVKSLNPAGRRTQDARRGLANADLVTTVQDLRFLGVALGRFMGATNQREVFTHLFRELKTIAENNPADLRRAARGWLRDNQISSTLTENYYRTIELMKDFNLDDLRTFSDDIVIAGDKAEFNRLIDENIDAVNAARREGNKKLAAELEKKRGLIFRDENAYGNAFTDDILEEAERRIYRRYGLNTEQTGLARARNRFNSALSRVFLENPGYVARNYVSNYALGTIMGELKLNYFFTFRRMKQDFRDAFAAFDPLSFGMSPGRPLNDQLAELVKQSDDGWRSILPKNRSFGELFGGGIGVIPALHFRRFNSWVEKVGRGELIRNAYNRLRVTMMSDRLILHTMQRTHPRLYALLARNPELREATLKLVRNPADLSVQQMNNLIASRVVPNGDTVLHFDPGVREVLEHANLSPHFDDMTLAQLTEDLMGSGPVSGERVRALIRQRIDDIDETGETMAQIFGIRPDEYRELMDLHTQVYDVARQGGLTPEMSKEFATVYLSQSASVLLPVNNRLKMLNEFLLDPEIYRKNRWSWIEGFDREQLDELVSFSKGAQKREIMEALYEEDALEGWRGLRDLMDFARETIDPQLLQQSPDITRAIQRVEDSMHAIDLDQWRRNALAARRFRDIRNSGWHLDIPTWDGTNITQSRHNLDRFITEAVALMDNAAELSWTSRTRGLQKYLPGTPPGEIRDAVMRAIERGHAKNKILPERFVNATLDDVSDAEFFRDANGVLRPAGVAKFDAQVRREASESLVRVTGRDPMNADTLRSTLDEIHTDVKFIADEMARIHLENMRPEIDEFLHATERRRAALFSQLQANIESNLRPAATDPTTQSVAQLTGDPSDLTGEAMRVQNELHNNFISEVGEQFNELAVRLDIETMPWGEDVQRAAARAGAYPAWQQPTQFGSWVAEMAPIRSTLSLSEDAAVELANARRVQFNEVITASYNDAENFIRNMTDVTNDDLIRMATDEPPQPLPLLVNTGDDRAVALEIKGIDGPMSIDETAPVAVVPAGRPATFPAEVHGRRFLNRAPEGYAPAITNDEAGKGLGRMAMFVREDATREDVIRGAKAQILTHNETRDAIRRGDITFGQLRAEATARGRGQFTTNTFEQNPNGFRAPAPFHAIEEADDVFIRELAPIVEKARDGDPVAIATLRATMEQRMNGWPMVDVTRWNKTKPPRTVQEVYDNFAEALPHTSRMWGATRTLAVSPDEAREFQSWIGDMNVARNQFDRSALEMANARADWVLHNYSNSYDFDYYLRFISPWHLWPTRTMAKFGARVADDPRFLVGWERVESVFREVNRDLPEWMQDQVPAEVLNPILMGLGVPGSPGGITLDPQGFLPFQDLQQRFDIGDPDEHTETGRVLQSLQDSVFGVSPFITGLGAATGQFGDRGREQFFSQLAESTTRAPDLALRLLDLTGRGVGLDFNIPLNTIRTNRDHWDVRNEYAIAIIKSVERGGRDRNSNKELDALINAYEEWITTDHFFDQDLIPFLGEEEILPGLFETNKVHRGIVDRAMRRRLIPTISSFGPGVRVNLGWEDRDSFNEFLNEALKVFDAEYKTKAEYNAAVDELFNHPAIRAYFLMENRSASAAEYEIARDELFEGFEDINSAADEALRNTPIDDYGEAARIQGQRFKDLDQHARDIDEKRGTDFSKEPERNSIDFLIPPTAANVLMERIRKGDDVPDWLVDISNDMLIRAVQAEEISERMVEAGINPRFAQPLDFIRYGWSTHLERQVAKYEAATDITQFLLKNDPENPNSETTNAVDWEEYIAHVEQVERDWGDQEELKLIKSSLARNRSPLAAVDNTIERMLRDNMAEYFSILEMDLEPAEKTRRLERAMRDFEAPSARDVSLRVLEDHGVFWVDQQGVGRAEIERIAKERLANLGTLGSINTFLDGSWKKRAAELGVDFNRLDDPEDDLDPTRVRHFQYPNSEGIVNTREELAEFEQAIKENERVREFKDAVPSWFADPDDPDLQMYWKYFAKEGKTAQTLQRNINKIIEFARSLPPGDARDRAWETTFALIDLKDDVLKRRDDDDESTTESGVRSVGTDPTRINSSYRIPRVGRNQPLSEVGERTKRFLNSKYFTGQFEDNAPSDYVYEILGQNGVATREEIVDFWESVYKTVQGPLAGLLARNDDVQDLLFAINNEEIDERTGLRTVATFRYLRGIQGLVDTIMGFPTLSTGAVTTAIDAPDIRQAPRGAQPTVRTSRSGAGGLPRWEEAVRYLNNVFNDPELLDAVVAHFNNPGRRLTNNQMRMLRFMHRQFDVGIDATFEQFLSALKLMYETATLLPVRQETRVNPASNFRFPEPRFARWRRD